jgi:hypothetical protein
MAKSAQVVSESIKVARLPRPAFTRQQDHLREFVVEHFLPSFVSYRHHVRLIVRQRPQHVPLGN